MKYLLSILVLFWGLSFADKYLVCDAPYSFYPDLEKQQLIKIYASDTKADIFSYSASDLEFSWKIYFIAAFPTHYNFESAGDISLREYIEKLKPSKDSNSDSFKYHFLNRETLVYTYTFGDDALRKGKQCRVVNKRAYDKALSDLQEFSNQQKAKRKI